MIPSDDKPDSRSRKNCPICGQPAHPDYRPFCSKRCADVDLNRWLGGVYAVPAQPAAEESDEEPSHRGPAVGEGS